MDSFIGRIKKLTKLLHVNKRCKKCKYVCDAKHFQHCFKKWSSGNNNTIDKFIKSTQLSAHKYTDETIRMDTL